MKILVDMGISPQTAALLRQLNYGAVHLHELGLGRMTDADILDKARKESRVVLTHDLDFPELMAAAGADLPSIIVFRLRNMRPAHVNEYVRYVLKEFESELKTGAIVTVTENQVRTRKLPLKLR